MDLHYWIVFVATVVGVSLIPGPSTFIAFAHGASFGAARAMLTATGNMGASLAQATAASAGLGLVVTSSASLFLAIKYAGALYLIFVGYQMWRSAAQRVSLDADAREKTPSSWRLMSGGFMVAASNPKAIAFFTALFPQFLSPAGNSTGQLVTMVVLVGVSAFSVAAFYGLLGAWVRGMELSKAFMRRLYKTTGGLFVASGLGLAATAQSR